MKLIDMLHCVSKKGSNCSDLVADEKFYQSLLLDSDCQHVSNYEQLFGERIACYWLRGGSDHPIGLGTRVIYFDRKPAGVYNITSKGGVNISYLTMEVVYEIRNFIMSLFKLDMVNVLSDRELHQQYDQLFQHPSSSEVATNRAVYKGVDVIINRLVYSYEVHMPSGEIVSPVAIDQLYFRYNLDEGVSRSD